jgi:hypothetical protein
MQSNDVTKYGEAVTTLNGQVTGRSLSAIYSNHFVVLNGNVQGDHILANPVEFTSTKKFGHTFLIQDEGDPTGIKDTIQITGVKIQSFPFIPSVVADYARTRDRALEKCFDQLRGESSNLIVDLAESAATISMLKNVLRVKSFFGDFVKKMVKSQRYQRLSNGQKRLDYVTGKWLEYRYGWMPLVYSTYDAINTFSKDVTRGVVNVKGRSGAEAIDSMESGDGSYTSPSTFVQRDLSWRSEYGLQFYLPPGLQIYDWTSLNPLAIAWELTPLSFVADWFLNVGQQLSLMENYWLFNSKFRTGYLTDSSRDVITMTRDGITIAMSSHKNLLVDIQRDGATQIATYKKRTVLLSLPFPSMNLRISCKLGASRLLDAASLLHQLIGRKSRGILQH